MQTKNIQRTLIAISLVTASSLSSAATIPYAVFDKVENDDHIDISTITNQSVIELAKVEKTRLDRINPLQRRSESQRSKNRKAMYSRFLRNKDKENTSSETLNTINDLTISATTSRVNKKHRQELTSGTWNYSGSETVDWLLVEYGKKVGLYQVTDNDTSGVWDIAELENYSSDYASARKGNQSRNRNNKVTFSAFSNPVAYAVITPVPVPAAAWLFISGLLGLVAIGKRKHIS